MDLQDIRLVMILYKGTCKIPQGTNTDSKIEPRTMTERTNDLAFLLKRR